MSAEANYFKLGIFVLVAFAGTSATAIAVGASASKKQVVEYHTYFNESVQGLNVGAPVTFRGVKIGAVSEIRIAPDHREVEVIEELDVQEIRRMGLSENGDKNSTRFEIPSDLRAQLGSQGITGMKFILIDFFDEKSNPVPTLAFEPDPNYIPAAASLFKNLEDSVVKAVDKFPELADSVASITKRIDAILSDIQSKKVPDQIVATFRAGELALQDLQSLFANIDREKIPQKVSAALARLDAAIAQLGGPKGLIDTLQNTAQIFGVAGQDASGGLRQFDQTLVDVSDAFQVIRELAEMLKRDPDMLLKGRSKAGPQ